MIQSPEVQQKIAHWQHLQSEGKMTPEDWAEAMLYLRQNRMNAQAAAAASKKKAPVDTSALKDSLRALKKI